MDALSLRRATLLVLLSLLLLAVASRLIFGVDAPNMVTMTGPPPNTAFGTTIYVGGTDAFEGGLRVWEFRDRFCPGPIRVLRLPLSGEAEPVSQILRRPGEGVTYWYNGTIYSEMERPVWLTRYAMERLRSLVRVRNRVPRNDFYLKIFHPDACAVPPTADWSTLAAAIHQ